MPGPVVAVHGLVKHYGETKAVDGVSFDVEPGEIFALLGPNGAGKTTTVEMLEGVRRPTAGVVRILGVDITDARAARNIRPRVGILPQEFNAFARLTVRENLEFFAAIYDNHASVLELQDLMGLTSQSRTRFSRLSGGLKQRVGLAAALVNDPDVVFLDEPTAGLDPEIRLSTWDLMRELSAKKKTVILTTHHMEEAQQLATRIAIIVKGKIAASGNLDELLRTIGGGKAMVFANGGDAAFGTLRRFFDSVHMEGPDVVLPFDRLRDLEVALTALVERGVETDVSIRTPTLEEVFLKLAGFKISESGDAK